METTSLNKFWCLGRPSVLLFYSVFETQKSYSVPEVYRKGHVNLFRILVFTTQGRFKYISVGEVGTLSDT